MSSLIEENRFFRLYITPCTDTDNPPWRWEDTVSIRVQDRKRVIESPKAPLWPYSYIPWGEGPWDWSAWEDPDPRWERHIGFLDTEEELRYWWEMYNHEDDLRAFPLQLKGHVLQFCDYKEEDGYIFAPVVPELVQLAAVADSSLTRNPREVAESYLEVFNQYLRGDVWEYLIEDLEGETVDACAGIYGYEEALREGRESLRHLIRGNSG